MSAFDEAFAQGCAVVLQAGMGDPVTYRVKSSGDETVVDGLVTREPVREMPTPEGYTRFRVVRVQVLVADLTGVTPVKGDMVTVGEDVFGVSEVTGPEGGIWNLMCEVEEPLRLGGHWM